MYIRTALTAALTALILMVIPLSADYSDAEYEGRIVITNAGDAVGGVTVKLETNTDALIDSGILESDFSNVWFTNAGGNSMAFMPKPGATDEWYFFYPWTLPATATSLSYLYMGGPDMSPPIRYLPGAGGMTTADTATLEPGNDWTIEIEGYFSFPTTQNTARKLVYKNDVVEVYCLKDGLFARALAGATVLPLYYRIDGAGSANSAGAQWSNPTLAYNDNTGDGATLTAVPATSWSSWLEITPSTAARAIPTATLQLYADLTASFTQVEVQAYYSGAWHQWYVGTYNDLAYTPIWGPGLYSVDKWQLRFYNASGAPATLANIFRNVQQETFPTIIMVAGINGLSDGAATVTLSYDGAKLTLTHNATSQDSNGHGLGGSPVLQANAQTWAYCSEASMPYVEYVKAWQGATPRLEIEYENAATFTDGSGNGNTATPSFPNASSDPDVSAVLDSLEPLAPADAPAWSTDEGGGLVPGVPAEPAGMYDEMATDHLPGAALVNTLLDAGGIPRTLFWFPLVFLGIVGLSLLTYKYTKSLMGMGLVASVALVFASRAGIVPYWVTVPLILIAVAVLVKEKMSPL